MTCEAIRDRLDDYVDGALDERERAETAAHLEGCESCRTQAHALRDLAAAAAALPRERVPRRDLWPAVAAELRSGPVAPLRPARPRLPLFGGLATAAALIAAVSSLVLLTGRPSVAPSATTPAASASAAGAPELLEPEREYARASRELTDALATRSEGLAPEARQSLEKDLEVIDEALVNVREALRQDPGNAGLNRLLATTHRLKVEALRRVLRLASI